MPTGELSLPVVPGVRHSWVPVGSTRLHVAEAGEGPPVLCLHGWPQHWWVWRGLLEGLADRHRVICPDLRGYGWSDVPRGGYEKERFATDAVGLLDALGLETVDLIAHDWGGVAGFMMCLAAPGRVRRYLALNTAHPFIRVREALPHVWRFGYQVLLAPPVVGPALAARVVPELVARIGAPTWTALERETYLAPFRQPARARAASLTYRTWLGREVMPILRGRYAGQRLRVPTLMLHGAGDVAIHPDLLRGGAAHADDFTLEVIPGVGHFIADEAPGLVLERARSFLG
jgi:pimeloyl-ACP methyl ester carboxylesterase